MKRVLLTSGLLLLTACGFRPMHATAIGQAAFNDIDVAVSDGRDEGDRAAGFLLRQRLADRIGQDAGGRYRLSIEPSVRRIGLGLTAQDRASRFDSVMSAKWTLTEAETGARIGRGSASSTATFSADRDPYRQFSTADQGVDRVTRDVADEVLAAVALAIADHEKTAARAP